MRIDDDLPPDPEGMNDQRAEWAGMCIQTLARATNMDTAGEDEETVLGDLLVNLMHWCDRHGVDFDQKLSTAVINYEAETEGGDE